MQCVPHLGASAKQLYVFQRTPSAIDVRDDRELDPAEFAGLGPGWQQQRMENFTALVGGAILAEDLVRDGWTSIPRNVLNVPEIPVLASGKTDYVSLNRIARAVRLPVKKAEPISLPELTQLTPDDLLAHYDTARLWPAGATPAADVPAAYQAQLALRRLRQARGRSRPKT